MLRYLSDVFSGRIRNWVDTNNVVISELWKRIDTLEPNAQLVFKQFLVSAGFVVEHIVGHKNQAKKTGMHFDLKKISREQFFNLYLPLLSYFVYLFYITNPELKDELKRDLGKLSDESRQIEKTIESLSKVDGLKMDLLGFKAWEEIVEVIGYGDKQSISQNIYFSLIAGNAYIGAVKEIKKKVGVA